MGCDIHIVIQRQELEGWREVAWQKVYSSIGQVPVDGFPSSPDVFDARNYDLFGVLANVRNGSGFAGITTGEGWPSIAQDRGLPDNFDPETVMPNPQYPEDGGRYIGDHSFTWVGLDELKAFDWDGVSTVLYGVVTAEEYERMMAESSNPFGPDQRPSEWCGGTMGLGIETYDRPTYLEKKRTNRLAKKSYVRTSWRETARQATNDWPGKVIPWLESLAEGRPLRLVLGFDS